MTEFLSVRLTQSLAVRILLAFVVIIAVMLGSMLGGMYLSDSIRGDAEALNKAGSLRMQAYRLALLASEAANQDLPVYRAEFEATLSNPALLSAVDKNMQHRLPEKYQSVEYQWRQLMLPLLQQTPPDKDAFRLQVPVFVELLDGFVGELQKESEQKLSYIRGLQVSTLFVSVLVGFLSILGVNNGLLMPLQELVELAKKIGLGSFEGRVKIAAHNELGVLAETFNHMSGELSDLYDNLEKKVDEKTAELQRSNRTLALLFNSARSLYKTSPDPLPNLADLLTPIEQTLGLGAVSLCLRDTRNNPRNVAHSAFSSQQGQAPEYCQLPNCAQCPVFINRNVSSGGIDMQVIRFPIRNEHQELGDLSVEVPVGKQMADWQERLMTALTELFSASLSLNQLGQEQARIALMEERAVIARELHDSLAQALSHQKIQLTRLKKQIAADFSKDDINTTLTDIQFGLNTAYRQLRELLVTFRIKLDQPGLATAVQATVQEFGRHSDVDIQLKYELEHCPLTPNEEIHCLQIIREALSNVIKHAQASQCKLGLYQDSEGYIHIIIDDDGIGINSKGSPEGHYGLNILTERAQSLSGRIYIGALAKGTRVHAQFLPDYKKHSIDVGE